MSLRVKPFLYALLICVVATVATIMTFGLDDIINDWRKAPFVSTCLLLFVAIFMFCLWYRGECYLEDYKKLRRKAKED